MHIKNQPIDNLSMNTIRMLAIESIEKAKSGHPGLPMGAAPMAHTLWSRFMKHNPKNPNWFDRDRFVLSAGHGSALLYSLLHVAGYNLPINELKNFRQLGSKTPGHPEVGHTEGVEATTGPLGQGFSMAVGMAMAERHLAATYNRDEFNIIDHFTYVLCGDGDLMEGVASEAASLAGHLKLGKLVVLYDSNDISLDGKLSMSFSEDTKKRFESYGWQYLRVEDGNIVSDIEDAIKKAKEDSSRPTIIEVKTTIGFGSPNKAGTKSVHGSPLGAEELQLTKEAYGWTYEPFTVPSEVRSQYDSVITVNETKENEWNVLFENYKKTYPELATELTYAISGEVHPDLENIFPSYEVGKGISTRNASGEIINVISKYVPQFFGGSADLSSSNITFMKEEKNFTAEDYSGKNIWYGVREHAMGAAMNGIALHGGLKTYGGTFFVFSDYLKPAIRLAAIQNVPVTYVFTHDSIAVGEDGPTHEPIEQLAGLRSIPNLIVFRPADFNETANAWAYAVRNKNNPVALVLSRQNLPILEGTKSADISKGGYVVAEASGVPELILVATGSEVSLAIDAKEKLESEGISTRVVSLPSWDLFDKQDESYKDSVLIPNVKRLSIEMASTFGWERYVEKHSHTIGIDTFGASGNGDTIVKEFGFTVENVVKRAKSIL